MMDVESEGKEGMGVEKGEGKKEWVWRWKGKKG